MKSFLRKLVTPAKDPTTINARALTMLIGLPLLIILGWCTYANSIPYQLSSIIPVYTAIHAFSTWVLSLSVNITSNNRRYFTLHACLFLSHTVAAIALFNAIFTTTSSTPINSLYGISLGTTFDTDNEQFNKFELIRKKAFTIDLVDKTLPNTIITLHTSSDATIISIEATTYIPTSNDTKTNSLLRNMLLEKSSDIENIHTISKIFYDDITKHDDEKNIKQLQHQTLDSIERAIASKYGRKDTIFFAVKRFDGSNYLTTHIRNKYSVSVTITQRPQKKHKTLHEALTQIDNKANLIINSEMK